MTRPGLTAGLSWKRKGSFSCPHSTPLPPRPPQPEIQGRDPKARSQIAELLQGQQPPAGHGSQCPAGRDDEVRVGAHVRSADASPELVELREPETVGPVHDERVHPWNVETV